MTRAQFPYPMWVISCDSCNDSWSLWEKPGTASGYIENCPGCGRSRPSIREVRTKEEHKEAMS